MAGEVTFMERHIELCRVLCMWPLEESRASSNMFYFHRSIVGFITTTTLILFIPITLKIIVEFENMDGVATAIDFATVFASGIFRYVYIFIRAPKFLNLIRLMNDTFIIESFYPADKKLKMEKYQKIGLFLGMFYIGCSFVWVLQMCVSPILAHAIQGNDLANLTDPRDIPLVLPAYYPFALDRQPNHTIVYTFQVIGFLLLAYIYLVTDAFWYMVIILTIGQVDLIDYSLRNCEEAGDAKEVQVAVETCVKQHQETRRFMREIEDLLSPIILVDFMHAVLSITFLLLDITIAMADGSWIKTFNLFEYFMVSLIHMFLLDYLGNELSIKDEQLSEAVFDTPWHVYPKELRLSVTMVTNQARQPFRLTGGKMYFVTLEFFVATIKTIFSYFMVLRQLRDDSNVKLSKSM